MLNPFQLRLASVQEQRTSVEPTPAEEAARTANEFASNSNKVRTAKLASKQVKHETS